MIARTLSSMEEKLRLEVFFESLSTNAGDCESPELTAVSPQRTSTYVVIGVASQSVLPAYDSKDACIVGRSRGIESFKVIRCAKRIITFRKNAIQYSS